METEVGYMGSKVIKGGVIEPELALLLDIGTDVASTVDGGSTGKSWSL